MINEAACTQDNSQIVRRRNRRNISSVNVLLNTTLSFEQLQGINNCDVADIEDALRGYTAAQMRFESVERKLKAGSLAVVTDDLKFCKSEFRNAKNRLIKLAYKFPSLVSHATFASVIRSE